MRKIFDCYITRNYQLLLKISKNITKSDIETSRELLHECLFQIYNRDEIKLKEYNDNSLKYYLTSIMRVNYYSNTSPYHYRIRKERQKILSILNVYVLSECEYYQEEHTYVGILVLVLLLCR